MKQVFLQFKRLLEEKMEFPKDELRDNYLYGAMTLLSKHHDLYKTIVEDETILHLVLKQLNQKNIHKVRLTKLKYMLLDIIENSPVEIMNKQDKNGNTATHIIVEKEQFSVGILDMMNEKGADYNLFNKNGELPIHIVSKSENLDDLKFIAGYTESGNYNAHNSITGDTPLIIALKNKKINNVYFLLENNVDVFKTNFQGNSPKDIVIKMLNEDSDETMKQILNIIELFEQKQKADRRIYELAHKHLSMNYEDDNEK